MSELENSIIKMLRMDPRPFATEWLPLRKVDVDEQVYVKLDERDFEHGDKSMPLDDFVAELREIEAKAPEGSEVTIEMGTGGYEGDYYATYEVGYWRDPTPAERAKREETNRKIEARDAANVAAKEQQELAELERLKAKYGA